MPMKRRRRSDSNAMTSGGLHVVFEADNDISLHDKRFADYTEPAAVLNNIITYRDDLADVNATLLGLGLVDAVDFKSELRFVRHFRTSLTTRIMFASPDAYRV